MTRALLSAGAVSYAFPLALALLLVVRFVLVPPPPRKLTPGMDFNERSSAAVNRSAAAGSTTARVLSLAWASSDRGSGVGDAADGIR